MPGRGYSFNVCPSAAWLVQIVSRFFKNKSSFEFTDNILYYLSLYTNCALLQLKKRVYYVRIERIDGGEKMNNSQNKNLLTEGSIWKKLMGFAFPLFLGNLFQQLYNTADSLIVGNFLGSDALAAVSSSGSLTFLLVGFFQGMAMGAGVIIARYFGARQQKELQKAIHTTVAFGILCGILLTISGVVLAPKILVLMKTPAHV